MNINTKTEFFDLWEKLCLGNRLGVWYKPKDVPLSAGKAVGFREIGKAGGGAFEICDVTEVVKVADKWTKLNRKFMICESAPDDKGLIQGEICKTFRGLEAYIAKVIDGRRMRDSIRDGFMKPYKGHAVNVILDTYMDASSRDDVNSLFELYPDATIEFTCYSCLVGLLPGRNTIFWEVRNY